MTPHKPVTEADIAAAVLVMLDVPFTLTAESAERDAERLGKARDEVRRLALAAASSRPAASDICPVCNNPLDIHEEGHHPPTKED